MMVVGALALLLLTAAIVVLYAMMGELASRIPESDGAGRVTPLTQFTRGATPARWPDALASLAGRHRTVLMVLSPICATCNKVAEELSGYQSARLGDAVGVVVSCSSRESGEDFIDHYSLGHLPHLVDEGGAWVTGSFGVKMSPSALVLEGGMLTDAYTFSKVGALLGQIVQAKEGVS